MHDQHKASRNDPTRYRGMRTCVSPCTLFVTPDAELTMDANMAMHEPGPSARRANREEKASSVVYQQGDALREAFGGPTGPEIDRLTLADVLDDPEAWDLSWDEYWSWVAQLIRAGRALDEQFNDVLHDAYACPTSFYNVGSWYRLKKLLSTLGKLQPQLRNLERDVKELALVIAADPDTPNTEAEHFTKIVLDDANKAYDRAYQLCQDKTARIQQGWVTVTNLLISVIMLVVTILFWMEFWE